MHRLPLKMKCTYLYLVAALLIGNAQAENLTVQTPLTMEQLMRELRIQGGNFVFTFDKPVIAKVTTTTTAYPEGKQSKEEFISDKPGKRVDLFFSVSPMFVGDYSRGDRTQQPIKMMIKLSDCKATEGTRIVHYDDKFIENKYASQEGQQGLYEPCIPLHPELNKEYILHYYFKEGDPYEAKATICFVERPEDFASVQKFSRNEPRRWKSANEVNKAD